MKKQVTQSLVLMSLLSAGCGSNPPPGNTTASQGAVRDTIRAFAPDFGGSAITVNYVHGSQLELGAGFSSLKNEVRPKCIEISDTGTAVGDARIWTGQHVDSSISTVTSYEDLESKLGIDASFSMGIGLSSGDMSVSYSQQNTFNSQDYFMIMRVNVVNQTETLKKVRLTEDAVRLLNQSPQDFLKACGDHYFAARTTGGTFSAVIHIAARSDAEKEQIRSKVEAGGLTWNASVAAKLDSMQKSGNYNMDIKIIRDGDSSALLGTASDIIQYGLAFNTFVGTQTGRAYPLTLTSSSYVPLALLDSRVHNPPIDPQADLELFEQMGRDYLQSLTARNNLEFALNHRNLYAPFNTAIVIEKVNDAQQMANAIKMNALDCASRLPEECTITYHIERLDSSMPALPLPPAPHLARVLSVQALFHTQGKDRDSSDGMTERVSLGDPGPGGQLLGQSISWGKGITFRNGVNDSGQRYDISTQNVTADTQPQLRYSWQMDQPDHEWDVLVTILVTMENGTTYTVFADTQRRQIGGGGNPSSGAIVLSVPRIMTQ